MSGRRRGRGKTTRDRAARRSAVRPLFGTQPVPSSSRTHRCCCLTLLPPSPSFPLISRRASRDAISDDTMQYRQTGRHAPLPTSSAAHTTNRPLGPFCTVKRTEDRKDKRRACASSLRATCRGRRSASGTTSGDGGGRAFPALRSPPRPHNMAGCMARHRVTKRIPLPTLKTRRTRAELQKERNTFCASTSIAEDDLFGLTAAGPKSADGCRDEEHDA